MNVLPMGQLYFPVPSGTSSRFSLEETFRPWLQQTLDAMLPLLPTIAGFVEPIPSTSLPPPLYAMDYQQPLNGTFDKLKLYSNGVDTPTPPQSAPARKGDQDNGHGSQPLKPDDWIWANLVKNRRVTAEDWWQDVREIELELEDEEMAPYPPGSICSLQPRMSRKEVDDFLEMNGWDDVADEVFCLRPLVPGKTPDPDIARVHSPNLDIDHPLPPHLPSEDTPTSLRSLLTNHLDLRGSPRLTFFEWLRRVSKDEREIERLGDFLTDPDEVFDYATRPSRTIIETLADFRETKLPKEYICEILPALRRRQFSIASSSEVCASATSSLRLVQ